MIASVKPPNRIFAAVARTRATRSGIPIQRKQLGIRLYFWDLCLTHCYHVQEGARLPYDVIGLVARHLADMLHAEILLGRPRSTLAILNRTSKAVHEVTLPFLYERTEYGSAMDFATSVTRKLSDGWKHTR